MTNPYGVRTPSGANGARTHAGGKAGGGPGKSSKGKGGGKKS